MYGIAKNSLAAIAAAAAVEAVTVEQIFNFTSYVSIENSVLRPNGNILLYVILSEGMRNPKLPL